MMAAVLTGKSQVLQSHDNTANKSNLHPPQPTVDPITLSYLVFSSLPLGSLQGVEGNQKYEEI